MPYIIPNAVTGVKSPKTNLSLCYQRGSVRDILDFTIDIDSRATEDSKARVLSLIERLKKNQEGSGIIQDLEE